MSSNAHLDIININLTINHIHNNNNLRFRVPVYNLTLKVQTKIAADDTKLFFSLLAFEENKA